MIRYLNKAIGREFKSQKRSFVYFGGTSYLDLQTHFRFKRWVLKGVLKYGVHHGASRHSNVRISLFRNTEKQLAKQAKAPQVVLVSSGYLAGQIVAKQFIDPNYECFYLPHTHSALKLNPFVKEVQTHLLHELINKAIAAQKTPVIFLDSIDFFGHHFPSFTPLNNLNLSDCIVVADDSHGLGVVSEQGAGSYEILSKMAPKKLIVTASLGKGLGISGGAIFTDSLSAEAIRNSPSYGGASPPSLGGLFAYLKSEEIYQKQLKKLHKNLRSFSKGVTDLNFFKFNLGHPAFSFQSEQLSEQLEQAGFVLTNFPYPTKKDPVMSRIVITAAHKKKDIKLLVQVVNTLLKE